MIIIIIIIMTIYVKPIPAPGANAFAAAPSGLLKRGKRVSLGSVLLWFKGYPKPLHGSGALGLRGLGFTTCGLHRGGHSAG